MISNRSGRAAASALVVTAVSLSSVSGLATAGGPTREWAAPVSGFFHDDFNWSPSFVPGALDEANISRDGAFTVSFSQNAVSDRLKVNAGTPTLDLGGHTYSLLRDSSLASSTASLLVGGTGTVVPRLTITNGELRLFSTKIGEDANHQGQLFVTGTSARLTMEKNLFLGLLGGQGDISVREGAHATMENAIVGVTQASGATTLSVMEAASGGAIDIANDLHVGQLNGDGLAGAAFSGTLSAQRALVGRGQGSSGELRSIASGLLHIRGDTLMGGNGQATMRAALGGSIVIGGTLDYGDGSLIEIQEGMLDVGSIKRSTNQANRIQLYSFSHLRVRNDLSTYDLGITTLGLDATVQVDGALVLDDRQPFHLNGFITNLSAGSIEGNGAFTITQGRFTLGSLILGAAPGQRASLAVGNAQSSSLSTDDFRVNGNTDIQSGGTLDITRYEAVFNGIFSNQGTLTIDQSTAEFNGVGPFNLNGLLSTGDMTITDSTVNGEVITGLGSGFAVGGDVVFNGNVHTRVGIANAVANERGQPAITFNGGLELGFNDSGIHHIAVDADVAFGANNTLVLEFGSPSTGQFDALTVNGSLTLDGALDISFLSGYTPTVGDEFGFIVADSISGVFSELTLAALPDHLFWDTGDINAGTIRIVPTPATAALLACGGLAGIGRRRIR